jgi:hypothetical protein
MNLSWVSAYLIGFLDTHTQVIETKFNSLLILMIRVLDSKNIAGKKVFLLIIA